MKKLLTYISEKMVYKSNTVKHKKDIFIPADINELKDKISKEIENCEKLNNNYLDLSNYDLSKLNDIEYLFEELLGDRHPIIKTIDVTDWNVSSIITMLDLFCDCEDIEEIVGLETWNTSNVTNMSAFFMNCEKLSDFDISKFNFDKVERLSFFFSGCESLTNIDISYIKCPNCKSINNLFSRCNNLKTIDVSNINVTNCETISSMFQYCQSLVKIIGLENWDVSNITKMDRFVGGCVDLQEANGLEKWKLSDSLKDTQNMFSYCKDLEIDLSNWIINRNKINATNMCLGTKKMKKPKFIKE